MAPVVQQRLCGGGRPSRGLAHPRARGGGGARRRQVPREARDAGYGGRGRREQWDDGREATWPPMRPESPGRVSLLRTTAALFLISVWLFPICRCRWKHKALQVEQHIVAGGKAHGRGKIAVALMLLIINALAQLAGVFSVPVSCAIWLIVSYLAATMQRIGNPILWG